MSASQNPWFDLPFKAMQMGVEAQTVIGLRLMRLSAGGSTAAAEAELMVTEKAWTALQAQAVFASNTLIGRHHQATDEALDLYRRRVRANRRRLSKPL